MVLPASKCFTPATLGLTLACQYESETTNRGAGDLQGLHCGRYGEYGTDSRCVRYAVSMHEGPERVVKGHFFWILWWPGGPQLSAASESNLPETFVIFTLKSVCDICSELDFNDKILHHDN